MDPISLIVASMQNDMQRINITANNAANALTPGFKRELSAVMNSQGLVDAESGVGAASGAPVLTTSVDVAQGVMKQTGRMLDFALSTKGFFEVSLPNGTAYTRRGAFQLDADGFLVTQDGRRVLGRSGPIYLDTTTPVVGRNGQILVDGTEVDRLRIVDVDDADALQSIGGGLFVAQGSALTAEVDNPRVYQGQLESSNVDSTREMVLLMEVYRHFEASSKVLQAYGDLKESTFTSLGSF